VQGLIARGRKGDERQKVGDEKKDGWSEPFILILKHLPNSVALL
jgi:hypothetical protein